MSLGKNGPVSGTVIVGTSSWADPGFIAEWYPPRLPARDRLPWYAERFQAVELNSSFYAIPAKELVERWCTTTPEHFVFDVKLHRLLSRHSTSLDQLPPDLRDEAETTNRGRVVLTPDLEREMVARIAGALEPLEQSGKLGALLLQLTPSFAPGRASLEELDPMIEGFSPRTVAVELRHRGWVSGESTGQTLAHLSDRGAAFVSVDAPPGDHVPILPPIDAVTCDRIAYLRCHGRNTEGYLKGRTVAERFNHNYSDAELREIADRAARLGEEVTEVHVMFNNNARDFAPKAARRFREIIGQDPGPTSDAQERLPMG